MSSYDWRCVAIALENNYIASIDAKDIYLASHYIKECDNGYTLKQKNGQYNLRKFVNSLDYSLDLPELNDIYFKKYRKRDFAFKIKNHYYSTEVINVTFKYSVKTWNQIHKNVYVKFGYDYNDLKFNDCIASNDAGEIVGVKINENVKNISQLQLPDFIDYQNSSSVKSYIKISEPKTIINNAELRKELYSNGFVCDGVEYCRMKRSSGSARVGKCLFVDKNLYKKIFQFSAKGLDIKEGQEIDLAAFESYISLPSSSIIGTIKICPENILVIDDYESSFNEDVIKTYNRNGVLITEEDNCNIKNSIWDGQSLMDISLFGEYSNYGMVLLRNLMFKSCCFNCNLQQWFKDNNITDVSQLNGYTRATKIEDVKLITTPNSIKYLKFSTLDKWLDNIYSDFGVVKHDKKTHFFHGKLVQTHYQLINTLQLSMDEMKEFLKPSLDFAQMLRDNPAVVREYIKYPEIDTFIPLTSPLKSKSDIVYNLIATNENFINTKYYQEFLQDLLRCYYKNLKCGHVYVNGNYSTLLGNPIEMLQQSIGRFNGGSQIGIGNIHNIRFEYGKELLGSRSPHVTCSNIWIANNAENKLIDCYMNLTEEIVCINSIGENVLQRLSGCDFDSDSILLTDNEVLLRAAKRNYNLFKTPNCAVKANKLKRYYTSEHQADLDIKTSVNLIGAVINLSQELNSLFWDRLYNGSTYEKEKELYFDICQLNALSGIEIDKAKKEFDVNTSKELDKLRQKYEPFLREYDENELGEAIKGKKKMPHFFAHISRQKGYYNPQKKNYCKYHTSMDYLQTIINGFRVKNPYKKNYLPFSAILNGENFRSSNVNQKQINKIYSLIKRYISDRNNIFGSDIDSKKKHIRIQILYDELVSNINGEIIGVSTMYRLLSSVELKENSKIKNILLQILFTCGNKSFKENIIKTSSLVDELSIGGDDMFLFGIGYKITKKRLN